MPEFKKQLAEDAAKGEEVRPPLLGYSRETAALHAVEVQLALVHRSLARNLRIPLPKGPVFPAEVLEQEHDTAEVIDLHADIAQAMKPEGEVEKYA